MSEPPWLTLQEVIDINANTVSSTGEPFRILDKGKLAGALKRAEHAHYYSEEQDILKLAVIIMVSVANAHAFMQGNKRTGFLAGHMFLNHNGYRLREGFDKRVDANGDSYMAYLLIEALSETYRDMERLETYLANFLEPIQDVEYPEIDDFI